VPLNASPPPRKRVSGANPRCGAPPGRDVLDCIAQIRHRRRCQTGREKASYKGRADERLRDVRGMNSKHVAHQDKKPCKQASRDRATW